MTSSSLPSRACRHCVSVGLAMALGGCAGLPAAVPRALEAAAPVAAGALADVVKTSGPEADGRSGFRLLPTPAYALDARLALAAHARGSLDVQYYELRADTTGRQLLAALQAAAQRGVHVRLLVDDLHAGDEACLFARLQHAGPLEVRLFNPFAVRGRNTLLRFAASPFDARRLERRMHNKLFLADGVLGIVGGRNIADDYFLRSAAANFLDLDLLVAGGMVSLLSQSFDAYWNSPWAYPVQLLAPSDCTEDAQAPARPEFLERALQHERDPLGIPPVGAELRAGRLTLVWAHGEVAWDPPDKVDPRWARTASGTGRPGDAGTVRAHLRARVARARHSVVATSPYLIPGSSGMALLGALRERGVHVSLVTNSMAAVDEPFAFIGYMRYRTRLLQLGVDLFELSPARVAHSRRFHLDGRSSGQLHAKAAVIDGRTVFIGSMNLDPRSDRHNTEVGVFVDSEVLSAQLLHLIDVVRSQGGYRVVLTADGVQRWRQDGDSSQQAGALADPETTRGQRFLLWLLDPLVPEDLL